MSVICVLVICVTVMYVNVIWVSVICVTVLFVTVIFVTVISVTVSDMFVVMIDVTYFLINTRRVTMVSGCGVYSVSGVSGDLLTSQVLLKFQLNLT